MLSDGQSPTGRRPLIAVVGSSSVSSEVADLAEVLGFELGRRGLSVLCGGRGGVMAATCRGLRRARIELEEAQPRSALAIGLLPGPEFDDANEWLDIAVPTGIGHARNTIIATGADAVVAVAGSAGTLSEIALAWQMKKPLCALTTSGGWASRLSDRAVDDRRQDHIVAASTPVEAAEWALGVVRDHVGA